MPVLSEKEQRFVIACGEGTVNDPYTWAEYSTREASGVWLGGYVMVGGEGLIEYIGTTELPEVTVTPDPAPMTIEQFYLWASYYGFQGGYSDYLAQHASGTFNDEDYGSGSNGGGGYYQNLVPVELMDAKYFVPWSISKECMTGAKAILTKFGFKSDFDSRVQFVSSSSTSIEHTKQGLSIINSNLDAGRPVIAGVMSSGAGDTNGSNQYANHFIVITGRGSDSQGIYYTYMDNGTDSVEKSINPTENRFYYNSTTGLWEDPSCYNGQHYTLTEVRDNY